MSIKRVWVQVTVGRVRSRSKSKTLGPKSDVSHI